MDTGFTPQCRANHLSSNSMIDVWNFGGIVSHSGNLHCPSFAILAPSNSPFLSVTTVEYSVPANNSFGRQKKYATARPAIRNITMRDIPLCVIS